MAFIIRETSAAVGRMFKGFSGYAPSLAKSVYEIRLGLTISHAIGRAHGGDVVVVSNTTLGSTFRLT